VTDVATLRADAEFLLQQLPSASLQAAAANVLHPGAAGRKRAGSGEQFWQYRRYAQTDAATRIDWRRSARGDEYFVRETELETARTVLFYCDANEGFDWASPSTPSTKAYRAKVIMLAIGTLLSKSGERIGVLSGPRPPSLGKSAPDKLAEDLLHRVPTDALQPPRSAAMPIIASDFYDGIDAWQTKLASVASTCRAGILFVVTDPVEHDFPYKGRTRFSRPGSALQRIFGRAETIREDYLERFAQHQTDLKSMAANLGWTIVQHRTDEPAIEGAAALLVALQQFGAKA
jgi:uncharacterized protein (DUF58 family)